MGLIIWIAINVCGLLDLLNYMDNVFSYEYDHKLILYKPYNKYFPSKQAVLLTLWDEVGLPHERHKQIFGPTIEIISVWVDPRDIIITMPTDSKAELIAAMREFIDMTCSHMHPLVEWQ